MCLAYHRYWDVDGVKWYRSEGILMDPSDRVGHLNTRVKSFRSETQTIGQR